MSQKTRVLFLDDEESIRATMPLMLEAHGFAVTSTGTVPDALRLISHEKFDVLIADLNVGNAGDGFTVVSAMRRTQPDAVNFILTGYPAFESALEAIRQQVDDYFIKPTEIEPLVRTIQAKLTQRTPTRGIQARRLPDIIEEHLEWIVKHWLTAVKKDGEIGAIPLPDADRQDHVPRLLLEAVERARGKQHSPSDTDAARGHGRMRRQQHYTIPLVVREAKLLLRSLAECVQQNLLAIQVSYLIPDMVKVWETIETQLEISIKSYLEAENSEEETATTSHLSRGSSKRT